MLRSGPESFDPLNLPVTNAIAITALLAVVAAREQTNPPYPPSF